MLGNLTKILIFVVVTLAGVATGKSALAVAVSATPSAIYCETNVTFNVTNMPTGHVAQYIDYKLTCVDGGCANDVVRIKYREDSGNNPSPVTVRFNISNQCADTQGVAAAGGIYKLELVDTQFANDVVLATAPYELILDGGVLRACTIDIQPPYSAAAGGHFFVNGPLGYVYNTEINGQPRNDLSFTMDTPIPGSASVGREQVNVPGSYLTQPENQLKVTGRSPTNTSDRFDCVSVIRLNTPTITLNKGEVGCGDSVTYTAKELYHTIAYTVQLECISGNPGTPGATECTDGTKITYDIPAGRGSSTYSFDKQYNINSGCGTGEAAKAGLYRVRLIDSSGTIAPSQPTIRLRFSTDTCSISGQENVLIANGVPANEVPFTLTAAPGTIWGIRINGEFLKSQRIESAGSATVTIPKSFINTTLGSTGSASNNILATKDGSGTQPTCTGIFQSYDLTWECGYVENDIASNCNACGDGRICSSTRRCVPDTTDKCSNPVPPPTENVCNLEDACGSCPVNGEVCDVFEGTGILYCKNDIENTCGELLTYDVITGITGNFQTFEEFLNALRGILIPLGIVLGVVFFLICGYKFMTSQGQPDKLRDAKECLTSAIIGLLVVTMSVSIINTLINLAFNIM